jgi:hypothetical protein
MNPSGLPGAVFPSWPFFMGGVKRGVLRAKLDTSVPKHGIASLLDPVERAASGPRSDITRRAAELLKSARRRLWKGKLSESPSTNARLVNALGVGVPPNQLGATCSTHTVPH